MSKIYIRGSLLALVILVASFYLPQLYRQLFFDQVAKTHLFYSPVIKEFIYKEKIVGPIPWQVQKNAEEQIVTSAYRSENGQWLHRLEFERLLPFIYYKDMEIRGLLPLEIDGHHFDKEAIKKNRRVLELRAVEMKTPETAVYPLFDSTPETVRLVFPKDRFYLSSTGLEFVSATTNKKDAILSEKVTSTLKQAGVCFPVKRIFGRFTVLKPFDLGIFLLDAHHRLFHLKQEQGVSTATEILISEGIQIKYIKVAESRTSRYCALAVGMNNTIWLLSYRSQRFAPLPVEGYDANSMDIKLLFNPLYITAVFSDAEEIHAVVMDKELNSIASFRHKMSKAEQTITKNIYHILFPFVLTDKKDGSNFVNIGIETSWYGLIGNMFVLILLFLFFRIKRHKPVKRPFFLLAFSGIYGVIGLFCVGLDE